MKVDLNKVFDAEGHSFVVEDTVDLTALKLWGEHPFQAPVAVTATAKNYLAMVTLDLSVVFTLQFTCARCLAAVSQSVTHTCSHRVVRQLNGPDDGEFLVCPDGFLDLTDLTTTDILLELPLVALCKDSCKGLCQTCGTNLNDQLCPCKKQAADIRFAALDSFFEK